MYGLNPDGSEPVIPPPSFRVTPPAGGWGRIDPRLTTDHWVLAFTGGCSVFSFGPFETQAEAQAAGEAWLVRLHERARNVERRRSDRDVIVRAKSAERYSDDLPF